MLFTKNKFEPPEFWIWKRFANWLAAARKVAKIAFVEVASIVTIEFPTGVVVPNDDGVVLPLTASASRAKEDAEILCRGERVCEELLSEETSTCK